MTKKRVRTWTGELTPPTPNDSILFKCKYKILFLKYNEK